MEDLPWYLANAQIVLKGKRRAVDTVVQSFVERDQRLLGKEGELTGFFGIYSGYAGDRATKIVEAQLKKHLTESPRYSSGSVQPRQLQSSLRKAMMKAQADIYEDWDKTGNYQGVHTTVVVLRDGYVVTANAGGGGAVICRADGFVGMLSTKTPRLDEVENVTVEQYGLDFEDECIIVGCHSFWDALNCEQATRLARDALRKHKNVKIATQTLAVAAQNAGAPGYVAVSVILLNGECAYGTQSSQEMEGAIAALSSKLSGTGSDLVMSDAGSESSRSSSRKFSMKGLSLKRKTSDRARESALVFGGL